MADTILVAVDSAYSASILVVVREMMGYGLNDNPETNAIIDYMPALFTYIESAAANLWQSSNEERGDPIEEQKEKTDRIIRCLQNAIIDFVKIRHALE